MNNYPTEKQSYYIDFNIDYSLVWADSCKIVDNTGHKVGDCSEEPVNANVNFNTGFCA